MIEIFFNHRLSSGRPFRPGPMGQYKNPETTDSIRSALFWSWQMPTVVKYFDAKLISF